MSAHNRIVLQAQPSGVFKEGILSGTAKAGQMVQIKAGVEMVGGRHTWELFDGSADGARALVAILSHPWWHFQDLSWTIPDGTRVAIYCPIPGDELQVLLGDVPGTGDSFAIGDRLMVDKGTGKFIAASGSEQSAPFVVMETLPAVTADTLCHVMFTGY